MKLKLRLLACALLLTLLTACGLTPAKEPITGADGQRSDQLNVVTTLFPYYDFARQIAGDHIKLTMVIPAGMDSHSFEPTPADMMTIQNADILICNGGVMEHWLEQVLEAVDTSHMKIITMMDYVDNVEELLVEGMEAEEDHDHDHEALIEYDEHIWTSPVNSMKLVRAISDVLKEADPPHKETYVSNTTAYLKELEALDRQFQKVAADKKRNMIMVGDKFPFRYLADEYGFEYRAAFSGCSTDTEPSAQTIAYLIDKIKEDKIPVIYYLELSSHLVSEVIAQETGAQPLLLHSCHNVTRQEFDGGITYLQLMEQNVENLRRGLDE